VPKKERLKNEKTWGKRKIRYREREREREREIWPCWHSGDTELGNCARLWSRLRGQTHTRILVYAETRWGHTWPKCVCVFVSTESTKFIWFLSFCLLIRNQMSQFMPFPVRICIFASLYQVQMFFKSFKSFTSIMLSIWIKHSVNATWGNTFFNSQSISGLSA